MNFQLILFAMWVFIYKNESSKYKYKMSFKAQQQNEDDNQTRKLLTRLDNLPFSRWHWMMVLALGLVWVFDGYQVSLISLFRKYIVQQTDQNTFKSLATSYQVGCIMGSLIFGVFSFVIGRKKIFIITLSIYAIGITFSFIPISIPFFIFGRFLTGISVGGQFTAIFSAIDEFLPPKYRGRVNIGIDGTWHLGGSLAAILNIIIGETQQWRYFFGVGMIGVVSLIFIRRNIPQSPRWLLLKGKNQQATQIIQKIQYAVQNNKFSLSSQSVVQDKGLKQLSSEINYPISNQLDTQRNTLNKSVHQICIVKDKQQFRYQVLCWLLAVIRESILKYKKRFYLAFFLMFSQAFIFSLIYYKFPAILQQKFNLSQSEISKYMIPLSLSSFVSTLLIGPFFDKIGRKQLLLITYVMSGILLIISQFCEQLFWLQICICFMLFFTSPAGSSANLIASQIFPTSSRTLMLFIMFIVGMFGSIGGVWFDTVYVGSGLMILAGIFGYALCPQSENKSLEEIQNL